MQVFQSPEYKNLENWRMTDANAPVMLYGHHYEKFPLPNFLENEVFKQIL